MNGYQATFQKTRGYGSSASGNSHGVQSDFIKSMAPAYPSIEDELKKDVAILKSTLEIRDYYITKLREAKDSLTRDLHFREMEVESLEDELKRYKAKFLEAKGLEFVELNRDE